MDMMPWQLGTPWIRHPWRDVSPQHRIPDWSGMEGPQSSSYAPPPAMGRDICSRPGCSKAPPTRPWILPGMEQPQLLWAPCARTSPPSQGRISSNPALWNGKPFPLSWHSRPTASSPGAPLGTGNGSKVSPEPSLLQAEQPQLSQPGSEQRGSSPWSISAASLNSLQQLHIFLMLDPRAGGSSAGGISAKQGRGAESPCPLLPTL